MTLPPGALLPLFLTCGLIASRYPPWAKAGTASRMTSELATMEGSLVAAVNFPTTWMSSPLGPSFWRVTWISPFWVAAAAENLKTEYEEEEMQQETTNLYQQ